MTHHPPPGNPAPEPADRPPLRRTRRRRWTRRALRYGRRRTVPPPPSPAEAPRDPAACLRREAAALYFPAPTTESSLRYLRKAIAGDPQLAGELRRAGYRSGSRFLSPRQQRILAEYFG